MENTSLPFNKLKKLKVLLADDEERICKMLSKLIDTEDLNLEIIGMAYDGEELLNKITEERPDIVVTDISMPKMTGIDVIKSVSKLNISCKFIIISGFRQFDYAYSALKYDVVDYLLKPVEQDDLNAALGKIAWQIRHKTDALPEGNTHSIHNYFLLKGIKTFLTAPQSLSSINATFRMNFHKGMFQVVLLRIDSLGKLRSLPENPGSLHGEVQNLIKQYTGDLCDEIVSTNDWDDIIAVLNYPEDRFEAVQAKLKEMFQVARKTIEMFGGVTATMCVGSAYADVNLIEKSKLEATDTAWKRMDRGIGKILYADEKSPEHGLSLNPFISGIEKKVQKSFETLNPEEFTDAIEELFSLPKYDLSNRKVKSFVRGIPEMFFDQNESIVSQLNNSKQIAKEIRYEMRMVTSFSACKSTLIKNITGLMEESRDFIHNRNTKPVRQAMEYVKKNYASQIHLDDVAGEVCLSSVYFSSVFKKETGQNFVDFLTGYRMEVAKKLLKNSNLNVKEIAYSVSYTDTRYFSKLFKKNVGLKPSDYRKIYD